MLAYLGRYTHRVAIANSRLVRCRRSSELSLADYRHHGKIKMMMLAADEFIRRFLLHVLPDGFLRIRYFGFLANGHRATKLALAGIFWRHRLRRRLHLPLTIGNLSPADRRRSTSAPFAAGG